MKNTHTGPRCGGQQVLRIEESSWAHGNNIAAGWLPAPVTRHLCAACGYSEEWIDDPENLKKLRKKYS
jgi:hypothetical protein